MKHFDSQTPLRLLVGSALLACLSCAGNPPDAAMTGDLPPEQWRFAIEEAEGSVQHAYALKFKELIEQRTDGQVQVAVYPYGTLGTSTQITEQLNLGVLEFAMASPGSLGKFIPEMQLFLLHFLFPEQDDRLATVLRDPQFLGLFDELYAEKGLKLLSIFSEGQMVWTADREIRRPADFRGVKFRVMTTPLLLASYNAYGASATPMPYSEVYSGLQLNMIDGQVNPVFAIERQKFHEVSDWMIFPGHAHFITTAAANRPFFEGLPPERRELVREVIGELDDYIFQVQRDFERQRLKKILANAQRKRTPLAIGGDVRGLLSEEDYRTLVEGNEFLQTTEPLTDAEREAFASRSRTVREAFQRYAGERGSELLAKTGELIARSLEQPLDSNAASSE
jgi:tripartite ATP-independent transporter DctP family solute receptor